MATSDIDTAAVAALFCGCCCHSLLSLYSCLSYYCYYCMHHIADGAAIYGCLLIRILLVVNVHLTAAQGCIFCRNFEIIPPPQKSSPIFRWKFFEKIENVLFFMIFIPFFSVFFPFMAFLSLCFQFFFPFSKLFYFFIALTGQFWKSSPNFPTTWNY